MYLQLFSRQYMMIYIYSGLHKQFNLRFPSFSLKGILFQAEFMNTVVLFPAAGCVRIYSSDDVCLVVRVTGFQMEVPRSIPCDVKCIKAGCFVSQRKRRPLEDLRHGRDPQQSVDAELPLVKTQLLTLAPNFRAYNKHGWDQVGSHLGCMSTHYECIDYKGCFTPNQVGVNFETLTRL